ncbi:hypothetical protein WJX73_006718 [Symbiochloris irregularis]|uniref:E2 ubiquitin-conjugating enzyme n=1 Tax=Symbiochloris irregularis TaxID=706552 RepID=A0AAW1PEB4_9CHLO
MDLGRIQKELKEIERDTASGVSVDVMGNSLQRLRGFVKGPRDTPYEGGMFVIDIILEDQYPFVPPKMRFITKVWHPNISSANGAICLDVLKDQWSPALTLKTALLSLQSLLALPQPDDPQDAVVAKQYLSEHTKYAQQAKSWTENFANPALASTQEQKVGQLVDMGFDEANSRAALRAAGGDVQAAMERLLSE